MENNSETLQKQILGLYEQGASDVEIARLLKVPLKKFYEMCSDMPAFNKVVELGRTFAQAWWESTARQNLVTKEFNTALFNFNMKNRYGWRDKIDTTESSSSDPTDVQQARAELERALRSIAKTNPEVLAGVNLTSIESDQ